MCKDQDGRKSPFCNPWVWGIPLECLFQVKSCLCSQSDCDLVVCFVLFFLQVTVLHSSLCLATRQGLTVLENILVSLTENCFLAFDSELLFFPSSGSRRRSDPLWKNICLINKSRLPLVCNDVAGWISEHYLIWKTLGKVPHSHPDSLCQLVNESACLFASKRPNIWRLQPILLWDWKQLTPWHVFFRLTL